MPNAPKLVEEKLNRILTAWKSLAPTETFGGMTVEQFETFIAPSKTARQHHAELEAQVTLVIGQRDIADRFSLGKADLVINGVIGNPSFGPDSPIYEAMGYTRKSERKSGLTRKGKGAAAGSSKP